MKNSKKICLFSLAPFIGGAEVALERLALGLTKKGLKPLCILGSNNEVGEHFTKKGIEWQYWPMPFPNKWNFLFYFFSVFRLRFFLKKQKINIIHANDLPSLQFVSLAAKPLKIPRICHHRYIFDGGAIKWFLKYNAEYHIYVSNALRHSLELNYPSLKDQPGQVVYDGLPIPQLPNDQEKIQIRRRLNLPLDKIIVLFAGQIIPRKGVKDLIEAWNLLPDKVQSQAHLVIIGDDLAGKGAYRTEMEHLAATLHVNIDFRGFQKNVNDWLNASDIVTVPSHIEPLGNATLEAMAHARPVIGSSVGGIPEMIVHGETGVLVQPKKPKSLSSALKYLIEDKNLTGQMGIKARKRCEDIFSLDKHVDDILNIYSKFFL